MIKLSPFDLHARTHKYGEEQLKPAVQLILPGEPSPDQLNQSHLHTCECEDKYLLLQAHWEGDDFLHSIVAAD